MHLPLLVSRILLRCVIQIEKQGTATDPLLRQPEEHVPIHPVHKIQDWDDAPGAIVWPKMARELAHVKSMGTVSDSHYSHDHLNEQKSVHIEEKVFKRWQHKFREIEFRGRNGTGEKVQWVIVDGFLLYWSPVSCPLPTFPHA